MKKSQLANEQIILAIKHAEAGAPIERFVESSARECQLHLADCINMPFDNYTFDAVIVHVGPHHLPTVPEDIEQTLAEAFHTTERMETRWGKLA